MIDRQARRRAMRRRDEETDTIQLPTQEAEAFRIWITQTLGNTISNPTLETLEQAFRQLSGEYDQRRRGVSSWTQDLLHDAFMETLGTIVRLLVMLGKEAAAVAPVPTIPQEKRSWVAPPADWKPHE